MRCDARRWDERDNGESRALPTCTPEFQPFRRRRVLENAILPPLPTIINQPPSSIVASPTPGAYLPAPASGMPIQPHPTNFRLHTGDECDTKTRSSPTSSAQTGCIEITQPQGL
ncbi:hypothetical protein BKA56DRAFT_320341 [Ilyonectria sp. MPI-CAGE-AT-0026]|nr:hypothetical protein BKA56DRAFT_320341 [Ilyonectria sp. MPI-CAGE-AT-0026]